MVVVSCYSCCSAGSKQIFAYDPHDGCYEPRAFPSACLSFPSNLEHRPPPPPLTRSHSLSKYEVCIYKLGLSFSRALQVTNRFTTVLPRSSPPPPSPTSATPGPLAPAQTTYLHGNISGDGDWRRRRRGWLHPGGVQQKGRNLRFWKTLRAQDQRVAPRPRPRPIAIITSHRRTVLRPLMLVPVLLAVPCCRERGRGRA